MTVFVIGAGFSRTAGYPLAKELLETLLRYGEKAEEATVTQYIRRYCAEEGIAPNIEALLTILDARLLYRSDDGNGRHDRDRAARAWLSDKLFEYFARRHQEDVEGRHSERRGVAHTFLYRHAKPGDTFITFNYDCLVELSLSELGLWDIESGYGFPVDLSFVPEAWYMSKSGDISPMPKLQHARGPRIQTSVLKCHGSIGWVAGSNGQIVLNPGASMLYEKLHEIRYLRDNPLDSVLNPLDALIEPSLIKRFEATQILDIWSQAMNALRGASHVAFVGYALTDADQAAQQLFRFALAGREDLRVSIIDPSNATHDRISGILRKASDVEPIDLETWISSSRSLG